MFMINDYQFNAFYQSLSREHVFSRSYLLIAITNW